MLTRCPSCNAVVNPAWGACLACREPLPEPGRPALPRPDFNAPCPPDVARIRETVKTWPASFATGWAELVVSAMVAGKDQHDAERLAFLPLAEDAPRWARESGEPPGPWPPVR